MAEDLHLENGQKITAGLRAAPGDMKRELRKSATQTAKFAGMWTRADAGRGSPQQRHMAGGIGWAGSSTSATMTLRNTAGAPGALGAFMGAKKYPQFPRAIAPNWRAMTPGEGPYVINPSLVRHEPEIDLVWLEGQAQATARALSPRF